MGEPPSAPERQPPGPVPGAVLGVAAGLLLAAVWAFGAWDVALALTGVFVGLLVTLTFGVGGWRPFGLAMAAASALVGAAFALLR